MIALPNHFGQSEILHPLDSRSAPRTFLSLRQDIVVLVLDTLLFVEEGLPLRADAALRELVHSDESCTDAGVRAVPAKRQDSVQKLFTQAVAAICKRLNLEHDSALKMDYDTTLTDCIGRVAPTWPDCQSDRTCLKSCVRWLCDFISSQCARPRQEHSRYLHSQIVATYDCLAQWALNYPQLLLDEDTLICLLEIIELGLSGSKSRVEHRGEATRFEPKWRKQKSPHSARLAPGGRVGAFPPALGPQTAYGSLLTEESFPDCRRRYLALNGSLILAVLEPVSQKRTLPSAIVIVRGPFGRQRPPAAPQSARRPPPDPSLLPYWCYTEGRRAPPYFPAEPPGLPAVRADASVPTLASVTPNSAEVLRLMAQARVPKRLPCPETPQCRPPASAKRVPTGQAHPHPARPAGHRLHFGLFYPGCAACTRPRCTLCPAEPAPATPDRLLAVSSAAAAASADFTSFCHGLGWAPANLPGNVAYWSDAVAEVVFHRPSGRPLEQSQPVLVWLEDAEDRAAFPPMPVCPRADPLVFVACRDRLLKSNPSVLEVSMGPNANCKPAAPLDFAPALLKGLVVPLRTAPCLVRQAILNCRRRLHMAYAASGHGKSSTGSPDPGEPFPHTNRQRKIQEIQRQ
uniref:Ral guanine nucleotide dissociation stimulator-like 3 n=1 Tax=Macrostomum lignano TaxID=282301 RepID=A0A1I8JPS9_9PLAT